MSENIAQQDQPPKTTLLNRHPVFAFLALAFLISWSGVLAITLPTGMPGQGETIDRLYGPVFACMLAGPFLSAIALSVGSQEWGGLAALFRGHLIWRARPFEYAVSFALIPLCACGVLLSLSVLSPAFKPGFLAPDFNLGAAAGMLLAGLAVGLIEETGWTGFATKRLLSRGRLLMMALGFGAVHGVWHLLVVIWSSGVDYGRNLLPFFLTLWLLALLTMRVLTVWIFARTGSTLLAAVTHASHSGWLFVLWPVSTTPAQDVIWTGLFGVLGLTASLLVFWRWPPPAKSGV